MGSAPRHVIRPDSAGWGARSPIEVQAILSTTTIRILALLVVAAGPVVTPPAATGQPLTLAQLDDDHDEPTGSVWDAVKEASERAVAMVPCQEAHTPACDGSCPPYNRCQAIRFGALAICSCVGELAVCGTNDPLCGGVCPPGLVCAGDVFGVGLCGCSAPLDVQPRGIPERPAPRLPEPEPQVFPKPVGTLKPPTTTTVATTTTTLKATTTVPTTTTLKATTTVPTTTTLKATTTVATTTTLKATTTVATTTTLRATTTVATTTTLRATTTVATTTTLKATTTVPRIPPPTSTTVRAIPPPVSRAAPVDCDAAGYPTCGGRCAAGESCVGHVDTGGVALCRCEPAVPVGPACGAATAPACDGACPGGTACIEDSNVGACACFDVFGATCGFLGAPECAGACPPETPLCKDDGSGSCVCSR